MTETQGRLVGLDDLGITDELSLALSYKIPGAEYSQQYRRGFWDGRERLLSKRLTFPVGLVPKVAEVLAGYGLQTEIKDSIEYPSSSAGIATHVQPYPYQEDVIAKALDAKRGTVQIATGGGKSIVIAHLAAALSVPTMIYVISLELLDQLSETLRKVLGCEIGVIGGSKCDIKKINVCSVWTAGIACGEKLDKSDEDDGATDDWSPSEIQRQAIRDTVAAAKLVILDESQFAAATTIRMILKNSQSAAYRYGFSATPWRASGDDLLLEAAFGRKICAITGTELIEKGYLVPPKIIFRDVPKLPKIGKNWKSVKAKYIVGNERRNGILVKNALKLLEMGRKPLMLFRDIKHGEVLRDLMSEHAKVELVSGQSSDEVRTGLKEKFSAGAIDILISSSILDQGFDLPKLDALVLCGGGKSTAKALQRVGRVLRTSPGKTDAIVVDTFDQSHYVDAHSYERYKIYKTERAFVVKTETAMTEFVRKQEWSEL